MEKPQITKQGKATNNKNQESESESNHKLEPRNRNWSVTAETHKKHEQKPSASQEVAARPKTKKDSKARKFGIVPRMIPCHK